jgi:predicted ribosomally synthesized peptide with nif11-like leader
MVDLFCTSDYLNRLAKAFSCVYSQKIMQIVKKTVYIDRVAQPNYYKKNKRGSMSNLSVFLQKLEDDSSFRQQVENADSLQKILDLASANKIQLTLDDIASELVDNPLSLDELSEVSGGKKRMYNYAFVEKKFFSKFKSFTKRFHSMNRELDQIPGRPDSSMTCCYSGGTQGSNCRTTG